MARGTQSWATIAIVALALLAIFGGLFIVGGPGQGRRENHDQVRMRDLLAISRQAQCLVDNGASLSAHVAPTEACPEDVRLTDPYTSEAYRVELIKPQNLRLCAGFEIAADDSGGVDYGLLGRDGDCVVSLIRDDSLSAPVLEPEMETQAPPVPGGPTVQP